MATTQLLTKEEWTTKHPDLPWWDGVHRFAKLTLDMTPLTIKYDTTPKKIELDMAMQKVEI